MATVVAKNHRHAGRMLGIFAGLNGGGRLIIASILFASASFGGGWSELYEICKKKFITPTRQYANTSLTS